MDMDARTPVFSVVSFRRDLRVSTAGAARSGARRRLFDRGRRAYRRAVREISEAMVSMLSAKEIVERILIR